MDKIIEGSYKKNCELFAMPPHRIKRLYRQAHKDCFWEKMYRAAFNDRPIDKKISWESNYEHSFVNHH